MCSIRDVSQCQRVDLLSIVSIAAICSGVARFLVRVNDLCPIAPHTGRYASRECIRWAPHRPDSGAYAALSRHFLQMGIPCRTFILCSDAFRFPPAIRCVIRAESLGMIEREYVTYGQHHHPSSCEETTFSNIDAHFGALRNQFGGHCASAQQH